MSVATNGAFLRVVEKPLAHAMGIVGEQMPDPVIAVIIAVVGWIMATVLRRVVSYVVSRVQAHLDHIEWVHARTQQLRIYRSAPKLLGGFVFWIVFLFFLVSALEALGLPVMSDLLQNVTMYLPRVLASLVILLAGIFASDIVRELVSGALTHLGAAYGQTLAKAVQAVIIVVSVIIAVEHIGVNSTVLTLVLSIAFGTTLGALALAFALGARSAVSNMLAVQQLSGNYQVGDTIRMGDVEGRITSITQTAVILEVGGNSVMIPGQRFNDEISTRIRAGSES